MATLTGENHKADTYKLRSSGVTAIGPNRFLAQSFGVDKNEITIWVATQGLPETTDFIGANPNGNYISANFSRLPYCIGNQIVFSGQTVGLTECDRDEESSLLGRITV